MGTAWTYASDVQEGHVAIRTRAGLMDVSGLKKLHLAGPHATAVLDYVTTRDVRKITPGRSAYACFLNEAGKFIDDGILYRTGPNAWMVVHGSGAAHESLAAAAYGRSVAMLYDDDLHDLSLQGPRAVDFLKRHVAGIGELKYFHHVQTTLFKRPVMISRTGYTGERGYEVFCKAADAPAIWDTILETGADLGIVPCAFTVLDLLRVESYLLFYPYDNSEMYPFADEPAGDTLWELGLDFTVSPGKTGFRGAAEHFRLRGRERFRIFGLIAESAEAVPSGAKVYDGESEVGVVTCAMVSTLTGESMAIGRLAPDYAVPGRPVRIGRGDDAVSAATHSLPFDDPGKTKRSAMG
jgi:aminomethyltransferase